MTRARAIARDLAALGAWVVVLLATLLLVVAVLAAGCRRKPETTLPKPVEIVERGCLGDLVDRPQWSEAVDAAGARDGCQAPWTACLTRDQLIALVRDIRAALAWRRDAEHRCGPAPAEPPIPDTPEGEQTP